MKIATLIARLLLGLIFTVFGLNGFLHFIQMPMPTGLAGEYMSVMSRSNIMSFVFLVQVVGGVLLLIGQFVPLALALLGPVLVNILLYHSLLNPAGIGNALLAAALWLFLFFRYYPSFAPLFANRRS